MAESETSLQKANNAKTTAQTNKEKVTNDKNNWNTTKNSMITWLKANVGQSLDTTTQNLADVIVSQASSARGVAVGYLQKTFDHLYKITKDPNWNTTVGGPSYTDVNGTDTTYPKSRVNNPTINTQN